MSRRRYNTRSGCRVQDKMPSCSENTINMMVDRIPETTLLTTQRESLPLSQPVVNEVDIFSVQDHISHPSEEVIAVTWVDSEVIEKSGRNLFGKEIQTDILQDVLTSFRVSKSTSPPPIPLCRLIVNVRYFFSMS
ncbi:hypothetical protein O6H91_19G010200 [Diphasiastrum complanatum]|uniref:Uncharacterized protein n=1 Tax=Diphasiastrum complanatum TaxID=34168 RepID=A0ACC2AST0_DIPCM|nr:hypothetical protein O6H91_19G010200 [Diphasiastrum complanatum]